MKFGKGVSFQIWLFLGIYVNQISGISKNQPASLKKTKSCLFGIISVGEINHWQPAREMTKELMGTLEASPISWNFIGFWVCFRVISCHFMGFRVISCDFMEFSVVFFVASPGRHSTGPSRSEVGPSGELRFVCRIFFSVMRWWKRCRFHSWKMKSTWNSKQPVFSNGCLVISNHFLMQRFGIIQLKQPFMNGCFMFHCIRGNLRAPAQCHVSPQEIAGIFLSGKKQVGEIVCIIHR